MSANYVSRIDFPVNFRRVYVFVGLCSLLCIFFTSNGCSQSQRGPARIAVTGTVKLDGQSVKKASVELIPKEGTNGPGTGAEIIDGQFTIPSAKGPVAGEYIFRFSGDSDVPTGETLETKGIVTPILVPLFPPKYGVASTESRKIGPDSTHFDFDLTSK